MNPDEVINAYLNFEIKREKALTLLQEKCGLDEKAATVLLDKTDKEYPE